MLKQLISLRFAFVYWIAGGLLLFVVLPLWVKQSSCPPKEPNIWTIEGQRNTTHNQGGSDEINNVLIAEQKKTDTKKNYLDNLYSPTWLCEETKFTDLLLAYFTYCLVIVGWFGIRSNELTIQNLERAFLAVGPTKIRLDWVRQPGKTVYVQGEPLETAVGLYIHNTGRTGATIKKVYGEFSKEAPSGDVPRYKDGTSFETDLSIAATTERDLSPIEFRDPSTDKQFFWGYIEYIDIFKNTRTARYCAAIFPSATGPGYYQIAGSAGWRDCD
jgi:hypothetical protein